MFVMIPNLSAPRMRCDIICSNMYNRIPTTFVDT